MIYVSQATHIKHILVYYLVSLKYVSVYKQVFQQVNCCENIQYNMELKLERFLSSIAMLMMITLPHIYENIKFKTKAAKKHH